MQTNETVEVVEELHPARANQRLADGWTLLAVVPGYDHHNAQAAGALDTSSPRGLVRLN